MSLQRLGGHRRIQPVADEFAEVDDVLALAGRGQKGLRRLGVQIIGQHVAHAAEQIEQDDAEIGVIEIGPAVGELRDLRQQLLTDRFVMYPMLARPMVSPVFGGYARAPDALATPVTYRKGHGCVGDGMVQRAGLAGASL